MKTYNLIITSEEILSNKTIKHYSMEDKFSDSSFDLFISEENKNFENDVLLLVLKNESFIEGIDYIFNNFQIIEINIINFSKAYYNFEYNNGDIIIPNTFIGKENKSIFLEPNIGENYDLKNFGLILNGICYSLGNSEKLTDKLENKLIQDSFDLVDFNTFYILKYIKKVSAVGKISALEVVYSEELDKKNIASNLFLVLDLII